MRLLLLEPPRGAEPKGRQERDVALHSVALHNTTATLQRVDGKAHNLGGHELEHALEVGNWHWFCKPKELEGWGAGCVQHR